ncbi:MAG: hypothetical protein M1834_009694 [Cirrosporium novae-zelandiae]|nr:MAG: hypothetical protein M1834_009694 [Cirrosporium novae-zelandiae]
MSRPSKRLRADSIVAASSSGEEIPISQALELLSAAKIKDILILASKMEPAVGALIRAQYLEYRQEQQEKVIDFDHYSKRIWHTINSDFSGYSGSRQYHGSFEVFESVKSSIINIANQASTSVSSRGTRRSAIETLRKIGKTICLSSGDTLGHEVQKQFQSDHTWEDAVKDVVLAMTPEERAWIRNGDLWSKFQEVEGLAQDYCIFEELPEILDLVDGITSSDDDHDVQGSEDMEEVEEEEDASDEEEEEDDTHAERDIRALASRPSISSQFVTWPTSGHGPVSHGLNALESILQPPLQTPTPPSSAPPTLPPITLPPPTSYNQLPLPISSNLPPTPFSSEAWVPSNQLDELRGGRNVHQSDGMLPHGLASYANGLNTTPSPHSQLSIKNTTNSPLPSIHECMVPPKSTENQGRRGLPGIQALLS